MNSIDWITVIACTIASAITVQIVIKMNIKKLNIVLHDFEHDVIEACTTEIVNYIKSNM